VCEQLFSGTQNLSKSQFTPVINKKSMVLRQMLDKSTNHYMVSNSITKKAKHERGCFNDQSARHNVAVDRSIDDDTTTQGRVALRDMTNVKARKR
jgi:N-acetylmuramoyl-L-alanine amidase CwlA